MFQVNRALPKSPQQQLKFLKIDKLDWKGGGNNDGDGVRRRRADEGIGAGGGVSSRVMLRGRRAAREAGCYGLFSPGVGAMWTRCALPSAPAST